MSKSGATDAVHINPCPARLQSNGPADRHKMAFLDRSRGSRRVGSSDDVCDKKAFECRMVRRGGGAGLEGADGVARAGLGWVRRN